MRRATISRYTARPLSSYFYPRSPCGERHTASCDAHHIGDISIHALLAESDAGSFTTRALLCGFLSTLSLRRATLVIRFLIPLKLFLSTLSLRRATLRVVDGSKSSIISIHALLAESDRWIPLLCSKRCISIHALLAESDARFCWFAVDSPDFYPRSPCGERRKQSSHHNSDQWISIHALLAESDLLLFLACNIGLAFLSTLSLRRATANAVDQILPGHISIHALLAESDCYCSWRATSYWHFYPRSPCGERRFYLCW